jgi:hypothetical protein
MQFQLLTRRSLLLRASSAATAAVVSAAPAPPPSPSPNALTDAERRAGWRLLFDGKSLAGWDDPGRKQPPGDSWFVENGWIVSHPKPRLREDLLTTEEFGDFELTWEWRLRPGANTGLKYRVQQRVFLDLSKMPAGSTEIQQHLAFEMSRHVSDRAKIAPNGQGKDYVVAFEFQLIDDAAHPDAKAAGGRHATGALYDMAAPTAHPAKPSGAINNARLLVRGDAVEHWINGTRVLQANLRGPAERKALLARWGASHPVYKLLTEMPHHRGPITLQHHGDRAWFRSLKLRPLG